MGLDITAYSRLKYVGKHYSGDWCPEDEQYDPVTYETRHVDAFAYSDFPRSFAGIPIVETRRTGGTEFIIGGCYELTEQTERHAFRAGSYSGYNRWREDLQRQFNPATDPDEPFYELIWFADNEGCIGELAAIELLADFRTHADRYVDPHPDNGYGRQRYEDWTRAFELAANGGLVDFH